MARPLKLSKWPLMGSKRSLKGSKWPLKGSKRTKKIEWLLAGFDRPLRKSKMLQKWVEKLLSGSEKPLSGTEEPLSRFERLPGRSERPVRGF